MTSVAASTASEAALLKAELSELRERSAAEVEELRSSASEAEAAAREELNRARSEAEAARSTSAEAEAALEEREAKVAELLSRLNEAQVGRKLESLQEKCVYISCIPFSFVEL